MRSFAYRALLAGLFLLPASLGVHLLRGQTAFTNRYSITDASSSPETQETCLRLGFAARSGLYLSNVRVVITDANDHVIAELLADGPWLQVALAAGTYNITASFDGVAHELRNVRLGDGDSGTHIIYWDLNIVPIDLLVQARGLTMA